MKDVTTREACGLLGISYSQALPVLKAAQIPARRCGAAYLWDAAAVDGLKSALEARGLGPTRPDADEGGSHAS